MGLDVADADNDGDMDVYITDISALPPAPGQNDLFANAFAQTGVLDMAYFNLAPCGFSWGTQWIDVDNNGWLDLHVATHAGFTDCLYFGNPTGWTDVATAAGLGQVQNSRGDMSADYDKDGWVDLLVINTLAVPSLFRNTSAAGFPANGWFHIKLVGDPTAAAPFNSSRDAIGARVAIVADLNADGILGAGETQFREVVSGSSNAASTSSLKLEFGVAGAPLVAGIAVFWPSGNIQTFVNVAINQCSTITEATGALTPGTC